jgi:hypothetical protein
LLSRKLFYVGAPQAMTPLNRNRIEELTIIANAPKDRFKDLLEFVERENRFKEWIKLVQLIAVLIVLSIVLLKKPEFIPYILSLLGTLFGVGAGVKKFLEKRAKLDK